VLAIQLVEVQAERDQVVMDLPSGSGGSAEAKAAAADRVVDLTQGFPAAAGSSKAAAAAGSAGSAGAAGEAKKERKQHEKPLPIAERIAFRVVWTVRAFPCVMLIHTPAQYRAHGGATRRAESRRVCRALHPRPRLERHLGDASSGSTSKKKR
jgi:hypothetical protein